MNDNNDNDDEGKNKNLTSLCDFLSYGFVLHAN